MEEIAESIYVNDSTYMDCDKITGTKLLQEGGFTLYKWHTNCNIKFHGKNHETIEHQFINQINKVKLKDLATY